MRHVGFLDVSATIRNYSELLLNLDGLTVNIIGPLVTTSHSALSHASTLPTVTRKLGLHKGLVITGRGKSSPEWPKAVVWLRTLYHDKMTVKLLTDTEESSLLLYTYLMLYLAWKIKYNDIKNVLQKENGHC